MAVVQRDKDRHLPSGKSTADIFGHRDVIRAINDNLNEHIEETGKRFDAVESKLDAVVSKVDALAEDVKAIKDHMVGGSS